MHKTIFIGELSLDGSIKSARGVLAICIEAKNMGIEKIIIPKSNLEETKIVNGIEIIGLDTLKNTIEYLNGNESKGYKNTVCKYSRNNDFDIDFSEVKGHIFAKRALEIVASGGHNCIFIGPPGSGKTMLIKRLKTILPQITLEESIEIMKLYSIKEYIEKSILYERPFRMPHHTITKTALIGGGKNAMPGEISLANLGVLFLDELLEFKRESIEALRSPLEDKIITINRSGISVTYPCNFMLLATINPCPCGYFGSSTKECTCTEKERKRYISKLSGPILDRFDIQTKISSVNYKDISEKNIETSEQIRTRVEKARKIQKLRYQNEKISLNSDLTSNLIEKYCKIDFDGKNILDKFYNKYSISTRAYYKIIKVSRTIADLEGCENIMKKHILEAIQYKGGIDEL